MNIRVNVVDFKSKVALEEALSIYRSNSAYWMVGAQFLLTRDEHVESFAKLSVDPNWNWDWFKAVEVLYEDEHVLLTRWEDKGNIVTNTSIIKDGLCWRAIVVRNPKK